MREEFTRHAWQDFNQRYHNTFGWYIPDTKREDHKILVQVLDVHEERATFTDATGFKYTAYANKGNVFEFIPVERAVYNTVNDVILCERVAARQWRRGLHKNNTSLLSVLNMCAVPLSFELLAELFGEDRTSVYIAHFFDNKRRGVALNSMFSIVDSVVLVYQQRIGEYQRDSGTISLSVPVFQQEISDLIRDMSLPISLKGV